MKPKAPAVEFDVVPFDCYCPTCGAAPKVRCMRPNGEYLTVWTFPKLFHATRVQRAREYEAGLLHAHTNAVEKQRKRLAK
jgi:hypothetical protein